LGTRSVQAVAPGDDGLLAGQQPIERGGKGFGALGLLVGRLNRRSSVVGQQVDDVPPLVPGLRPAVQQDDGQLSL